MSDKKENNQKKVHKVGLASESHPSTETRSRKNRKLYTQRIFDDWCKACGICSAFCPRSVIGREENGAPRIENQDDCIGCRFCELHCPDFAITISERDVNSNRGSL